MKKINAKIHANILIQKRVHLIVRVRTNLTEIALPYVGICRGDKGGDRRGFWYIWGDKVSTLSSPSYYRWKEGSTSRLSPLSIKSVVLTDETDLGNATFIDCTTITNITLPLGLKNIGTGSFSNCNSLASIIIPNSVTNIGTRAFDRCTSMKSVKIGTGVKSLGDNIFANCGMVSSVQIPECVCNRSMASMFPSSYSNISRAIIIDGAREIAVSAFAGCTGLSSIVIPYGVTNICSNAFASCRSLASVIIPDSVESLGNGAFSH